jgi:HTH-type transcriptional regulator / antitoxin HipB
MENNKLKIYSLDEAKDKHLGKIGTERRDKYEYELRLDLLGEMKRQGESKNQVILPEKDSPSGRQTVRSNHFHKKR